MLKAMHGVDAGIRNLGWLMLFDQQYSGLGKIGSTDSQLYASVTVQNDRKRAGRVVSTALWIGVIAGLAITASLLIFGQAALAATGEAVHDIHTLKLHIHGLGCSSHSLLAMRHDVLSCWIFR